MSGRGVGQRAWSTDKERIFLQTLRHTGNVTAATEAAQADRSFVYRRRNSNARFRKLWREAMEEALDKLEAVLWEKALGLSNGSGAVKGRPGLPAGQKKNTDERLAIFLLKAHRPEIFAIKSNKNQKTPQMSDSPRRKLLDQLNDMAARKGDDMPEQTIADLPGE
ncbi:hypothetical protein [Luteithermobacter gelatinilyticus]|uniref:hypothetical protein n=1 Tax=Luteithermobacter gelatinilyticus TaxID=2582913 RepID=UPI001105BFFB|nr:hypothetical protein [Luteithermobacter gelatinilyticus]